MKCQTGWYGVALAGLLVFGLGTTTLAVELSGCITCHIDKEMLVKNASADTSSKSALQSGAG